ncbi:Coatomer subunit zeta [Pseudomonas donghuensis]
MSSDQYFLWKVTGEQHFVALVFSKVNIDVQIRCRKDLQEATRVPIQLLIARPCRHL